MVNPGIQTGSVNEIWNEFFHNRRPEIREKLVEYYLSLVKLVAGRLAIGLPRHVDRDDLVSAGFFGLLDAIERFDPYRGIKFETYAAARIRGAIIDALRAQDWLPASVRQKSRQYEQAVAGLENRLGRSATDDEIAAELGLSLEQLHGLLNQISARTLIPLDEFIRTETVSGQEDSPSQGIEAEEVKKLLAKGVDRLPDKERMVVALYYYEGLTLKEISLILKLSEARISQLHTKAVFRLRGFLSRYKTSLL